MDIIEFWSKQTKIWNDNSYCGRCWEFGAPLTESALNIQQIENCCVHLFVTNVRISTINNYTNGLFIQNKICQHSFTLYAVVPDLLSKNNYNEIKGHDISESRWETILKGLGNCLGCDKIIDECVIQGELFKITQWSMETVTNYADLNYTGWKIQGQFQIEY